MFKVGKKTKAWEQARKELKDEFFKKGITTCELRMPGCWFNNALSFAHTRKRRNMDDIKRVVLACIPCHQIVEAWPESKMEEYLENIIKNRK